MIIAATFNWKADTILFSSSGKRNEHFDLQCTGVIASSSMSLDVARDARKFPWILLPPPGSRLQYLSFPKFQRIFVISVLLEDRFCSWYFATWPETYFMKTMPKFRSKAKVRDCVRESVYFFTFTRIKYFTFALTLLGNCAWI